MLCNTDVDSTSTVVIGINYVNYGEYTKDSRSWCPWISQVKKSGGSETILFTTGFKNLKYSQIKYYPREMVVIMPCPGSMQLSYTGIVSVIKS